MKNMISLIKFAFQKKAVHNFFLQKMCSYISLKNHAPIDQIVNVSDKIKMRMSFFTDYDDVFSHYVNFVIDTTQVLGDLL